jgi:hypothetical protein
MGNSRADRETHLRLLDLSEGVLALALGNHPSPVFEFRCEPVYRYYALPEQYRPRGLVPLWECCGGVVCCRHSVEGLEFLELDVETPLELRRIARSEQGLLFWLFSYLIEDQDWEDEAATAALLKSAAEAVGFKHFTRVNYFQQKQGKELDYARLLRDEAWNVLA